MQPDFGGVLRKKYKTAKDGTMGEFDPGPFRMLFRKPTNPVGSRRKLLWIALTNSLLIRSEPFFG